MSGLAGLSHIVGQMVSRGAGPYGRKAFVEAVDRLGAHVDVSVSRHHTLLWVDGLARHFDALLDLAATALEAPHHDAAEFDRLRREIDAELDEVRDDDGALGARAFARGLYGGHPYGRPLKGSHRSLAALTRDAVVDRHRTLFGGPDVLGGIAGALGEEALVKAMERLAPRRAAALPTPKPDRVPPLPRRDGLRVVVVDKPERAQTQLFLGQPTLDLGHPDWTALQLAQTAFGGMFTAPLAQEIREKRGWSYSVWSALHSDAWLGTFQIRLHPNAPEAVPALALTLELLQHFHAHGPAEADFLAARNNLARSHVFGIDTATRLMWERMNTALAGREAAWLDDAVARYEAVSHAEAVAAAKAHLDPSAMTITLVCTAKDVLPALEAMPGIADIEVLDWTFDVEDPTGA
jgi:zinc protease